MSVITDSKIMLEVGSSCLKDFLATDSIGGILFQASFIQSIGDILENGRERGERSNPVYNLEIVIATAINSIRNCGYISRAKAQETESCSTAGEVMYMLNGDRYNKIPPYKPTQEELDEAVKIIEYIKTITTENDYKYNLHNIANVEHGYVSGRFIGYAVSMIPFYRKAMDLIIAKEKKVPSEYVGTIGKRETFSVTLMGMVGFETAFGFMTIFRFEDTDGNVIVWKSTTGVDLEKGDVVEVTAMVKAHDDYKGNKQTVINRPKFKKVN